jgi:arylsulfatase A-like enzyme
MRKTHHHDGAKPWRGMKRDDWEGGHRTPFVVKWPGKVKAGSVTNQLFSHVDIMATCAEIVNAELPENAAEDSYNFLPVFLGDQGDKPLRKYMVQQTNRLELSIRDGMWKYLDHKGSGGNDYKNKSELAPYRIVDNDPDALGQLYNLKTDPGETNNLYSEYPEKVKEMKKQLDFYRENGQVHKRE